MSRLSTIAALSSLFALGINAQSDICESVKGFSTYDSHGEFVFTGFFSGPDNIGPCECGDWKYSQNVISNGTTAVQNYYLDTQGEISGTETNNATGVCTEGLRVFDGNSYFFSKEVLQRGLEDQGDCKVMLGEQCADALKMHFRREAMKYISSGGCPGDGGLEQNTTVPWECADLVGGSETWFENQLWAAAADPVTSLDVLSADNACPAFDNSTSLSGVNAHLLGGVPVALAQAVRFPTPTFFTFFPNTEEARAELAASDTNFDVEESEAWNAPGTWVQLSCIAANGSVGVEVPSVEELLGRIPEGVEVPILVEEASPTGNATAGAKPECTLH